VGDWTDWLPGRRRRKTTEERLAEPEVTGRNRAVAREVGEDADTAAAIHEAEHRVRRVTWLLAIIALVVSSVGVVTAGSGSFAQTAYVISIATATIASAVAAITKGTR
jgi:hypothetical protein